MTQAKCEQLGGLWTALNDGTGASGCWMVGEDNASCTATCAAAGLTCSDAPWRTTEDCSESTALGAYRTLKICHPAADGPEPGHPLCRQSEPNQDVCQSTATMELAASHDACDVEGSSQYWWKRLCVCQ